MQEKETIGHRTISDPTPTISLPALAGEPPRQVSLQEAHALAGQYHAAGKLDDALGVLVWGWAAATLCFLVSLGTGVRVWREHKVVLLWVLPITLYVMFLAAWGIGALVGPYWRPHWL